MKWSQEREEGPKASVLGTLSMVVCSQPAEMLQVQLEKLARDVRSREQGVNAHISDEDCKVWMDTLQRVQLQIRQTDPSVKTAAATREAWMEELRHIHNSIIEKVMAQRLATL